MERGVDVLRMRMIVGVSARLLQLEPAGPRGAMECIAEDTIVLVRRDKVYRPFRLKKGRCILLCMCRIRTGLVGVDSKYRKWIRSPRLLCLATL